MRARWMAAAAASVAGVAGLASPTVQAQSAVPTSWVSGPSILYAPPATAPQLANSGVWTAPPLLVSGAHAYVGGEFLYQDFLYDDSGANGRIPDPTDKRISANSFSSYTGTYSYPTDARYGGNAADLVELRVKPLTDSTAFRITLTRLADPSLVAATIAIGTSSSPLRAFPFGAGAAGQADHFLTVHGTTAQLDSTPVAVSIDQNAAQIDVTIPHAVWDPGSSVVRLTAGV